MTNRFTSFVLFLFLSFSCYFNIACSVSASEQKQKNVSVQLNKSVTESQNVKNISAENLQKVCFINDSIGWIISEHNIYKTTNGGSDWKQIDLKIPQNSIIKDMYFVNQNTGWLLLQKQIVRTNIVENEYYFWAYKTDDGGLNWKNQFETNNVFVSQIYFADDKTGWITGEKYVYQPSWNRLVFTLKTSDKGQNWSDVSDEVNRSLIQPFGGVNDQLRGIYAKDSSNVFLVTGTRKIVMSPDGGKIWNFDRELTFEKQRKVKVDDNAYLIDLTFSAVKIGGNLSNGRLWIAGNLKNRSFHSANVRGEVSVETEKNSWTNYIFERFEISDVQFFDSTKIVVCGNTKSEDFSEAAVLYSADSGNTWKTVYLNKTNEKLTSVSIVQNKIFIVGDAGKIIDIEIP